MTAHPSSDCASIRDLIEVHALRALEPADADRVEEHLLTCRACDELSRSYQTFVPLLGMASPSVGPAREVRASLLTTIRAEQAPQPARPTPVRAPQAWLPARLRAWRIPQALSAPTIGLLLLLGGIAVSSQYQLDGQRDRVAVLQQQNIGLSSHLEAIRIGKETYGTGVRVMAFSQAAPGSPASGLLMTGPDRQSILISLWNVPAPADSLHIILGSEGEEDVALGSIEIDASGVGSVQVSLPAAIETYDSVRIVQSPTSATSSPAELLVLDLASQSAPVVAAD